MTSCYRFAVTQHKMRRRHLESVSAAPYGSTFQHLLKSPIRIQPQLKRKGVLGHSPKCVLVWGPRRDARPAGERRSGGALEGCLSHRDSDPTWSKARDDAYAQKERPGGEPYRPSPFGDFVTPLGDYNLSPPGRRTGLAPCKINAPPLGDYNLDLKILLLLFFTEKERPRWVGVLPKPCKRPLPPARRPPTRPKIS